MRFKTPCASTPSPLPPFHCSWGHFPLLTEHLAPGFQSSPSAQILYNLPVLAVFACRIHPRSHLGPCIPSSCSISETTSANVLLPGPLLLPANLLGHCGCTLTSSQCLIYLSCYFLPIQKPFLFLISLLIQFRFYYSFNFLIYLALCIFDAFF